MDDSFKNAAQAYTEAPSEKKVSQQSSARRFSSESLFQGSRELCIAHGSEEYRLRITKQGKLILTK